MNKNETLAPKELEHINSEIFQSFNPEDASWITGGKIVYTYLACVNSDGSLSVAIDIRE